MIFYTEQLKEHFPEIVEWINSMSREELLEQVYKVAITDLNLEKPLLGIGHPSLEEIEISPETKVQRLTSKDKESLKNAWLHQGDLESVPNFKDLEHILNEENPELIYIWGMYQFSSAALNHLVEIL